MLKLFGFELYFFGRKNLTRHEFMHTLVGTFISSVDAQMIDGTTYFPIKISLPPRYSRILFFQSEDIKKAWINYLKEASLSMTFEDFYEEGELLGNGSMGDVKLCKHKVMGKSYAVKII